KKTLHFHMRKGFFYLLGVTLFSSAVTIGVYKMAGLDHQEVVFQKVDSEPKTLQADSYVQLTKQEPGSVKRTGEVPFDFTEAADKSTPAVVHIVAKQENKGPQRRGNQMDLFREFFGDEFFRGGPQGAQPNEASGSGVILSQDGFIVTNNHVVEGAREIKVILNDKKTFEAKVIGLDPSTDLAVIKVEATALPTITIGNSDDVRVGQWVLAVGNPFNLESTVTAGIVSAKGRSLDILREKDRAPIEAFIQTDAAVNPGNSGGALINTEGHLIGINTAIATPTGTYAGYSFAVPVNIMNKVTKDLIEYGSVQRGFLGITIRELNGTYAKELGLEGITEGVRVQEVSPDGAAGAAGIKSGDIIVRLDNREIKTSPQLLEEIAKRRPGNRVEVEVIRDKKKKTFEVFLKNQSGNTEIVRNETVANPLKKLGVEFENLSSQELRDLGIKSGVRVKRILDGKIRRETDMREGFIITEFNQKPVGTAQDLEKKMTEHQGGVFFTGIYPDYNGEYYYAFGM
ncbi:MAG: Do family serine endopeptidase, partial [Bacteroidota bacterium]